MLHSVSLQRIPGLQDDHAAVLLFLFVLTAFFPQIANQEDKIRKMQCVHRKSVIKISGARLAIWHSRRWDLASCKRDAMGFRV
ncbi:hypothetical protein L1887_22287 [Cichorium endivia]|nr:hypothetical protein L1887_22287 [Cichorium endivia]